jgi:hypothetical protein
MQIYALAAAAATVVSSLLHTVCLWMRLRTERYRWEATERLTDRHGPQILGKIAHVAPALRDGWRPRSGVNGDVTRLRGGRG